MSNFTVQHVSEEGIIRVRMQGEFDLQVLNKSTSTFIEEMSRCNCNRVLLDHREATPNVSVIDIYDRPKFLSTAGLPRWAKIAIVYSTREEDYKFLETVSQNKGFNLKVFTDIDGGTKWLKS